MEEWGKEKRRRGKENKDKKDEMQP